MISTSKHKTRRRPSSRTKSGGRPRLAASTVRRDGGAAGVTAAPAVQRAPAPSGGAPAALPPLVGLFSLPSTSGSVTAVSTSFAGEGFLGDLVDAIAFETDPASGDPVAAQPPVTWQAFPSAAGIQLIGMSYDDATARVSPCAGLASGGCNAVQFFVDPSLQSLVGSNVVLRAARPGDPASVVNSIRIKDPLAGRGPEDQIATRLFELMERCIFGGKLAGKKQQRVIDLLAGRSQQSVAAIGQRFQALTDRAVSGTLAKGVQLTFKCVRKETLEEAIKRRLRGERRAQALALLGGSSAATAGAGSTLDLLAEVETASGADDAAGLEDILGTQFTTAADRGGSNVCDDPGRRRKLLLAAGAAAVLADKAIAKMSQDAAPPGSDFESNRLSGPFRSTFFPDGLDNYPSTEISRTKEAVAQTLSDARNTLLKRSSFACASETDTDCQAQAVASHGGLSSRRRLADTFPSRGNAVVVCPRFFPKSHGVQTIAVLHEFVHQAAISHPSEAYREDSQWPQLKHADAMRMADAYATFAWEVVHNRLPR